MKPTLILSAAALILVCGPSGAATVINGNFEDNAAAFTVFPGYTGGANPASITGWTITGAGGINPIANAQAPFIDGVNTGAFAFIQNTSRIEQTVADFVVGESYVLSLTFNARNCCGGELPLATFFLDNTELASSADEFPAPGAVVPASVGNGGTWWSTDIPFSATATSHVIGFRTTPVSGVAAADATFLLDNVEITVVPEPSAALLAVAAGAALFRRRRR